VTPPQSGSLNFLSVDIASVASPAFVSTRPLPTLGRAPSPDMEYNRDATKEPDSAFDE
jgi:hypothetical protein